MLKFIVFSDLHIVAEGKLSHGLDTAARLAAGIDFVNHHHTDAAFAVFAGDLADHGEPLAYQRFKQAINLLHIPAILTLGNHDDLAAFVECFGESQINRDTGHIDHVIEHADHRVIVMDTLLAAKAAGRLQDEQLNWLRQQLESSRHRPVIIVMHHNITLFYVPTDDIILENSEAFIGLVSGYRNVRQIISGHVHMSVAGSVRGIAFCTIAGGHYSIEPRLGAVPHQGSQYFVPRREGSAQLAVVLSDEKTTVVHMENYLDRHLIMAPELFD